MSCNMDLDFWPFVAEVEMAGNAGATITLRKGTRV